MISDKEGKARDKEFEWASGKIKNLSKIKMRNFANSPKEFGKLKRDLELDQAAFKPVFEKLAPINFKKSNLKEAIIVGINSKSIEKEQLHKIIFKDSRKELRSLKLEVGGHQYQNATEETWKTNENHFQFQEKVIKIQDISNTQIKVKQEKLERFKEFSNQFYE